MASGLLNSAVQLAAEISAVDFAPRPGLFLRPTTCEGFDSHELRSFLTSCTIHGQAEEPTKAHTDSHDIIMGLGKIDTPRKETLVPPCIFFLLGHK